MVALTRVACLAGTFGSGLSAWIVESARGWFLGLGWSARTVEVATAGVHALGLATLVELTAVPFSWYVAVVLERRYRGAHRAGAGWFGAQIRIVAMRTGLWIAVTVAVYAVMPRWPGTWWLVAGLSYGAITLAITYVSPLVVLPWLYDLRPLDRPGLQARLGSLAERAGARVVGIMEWKLGLESQRANAALVGIGPTRRILLSDVLLADYTDEEIEVIVAHELAHHVNNDVWQTVTYETVAAIAAAGIADAGMRIVGPLVGAARVWDPAGLPLVAIIATAVVVSLRPVGQLLSRLHERRADRDALVMTRNPIALETGLRRLSEQHLAEEQPSRLVEWLYFSHPPTADRLAAARAATERPRG